MNARVYDSDIGRFLSADTIIQDPHDSQSYNRYSYVRNNPLKYTDPTGNSWWTKFRDKWVKPIVSIIVAAVIVAGSGGLGILGGVLGNLGAGGGAILAGAVSGGIMTGSWQGALQGAIFGAVGAGFAAGIGNAFQKVIPHGANLINNAKYGAQFLKAASHGLSRAAISMVQGGTFKSGFASGFASSFFSPGTELGGDNAGGFTLRTTIAGVVGGTASEIGGGKFSNGAVSGAFVHMFNAERILKEYTLGIHTNTNSNARFHKGHAWISITSNQTGEINTYGLYADQELPMHESFGTGGVQVDIELQGNYSYKTNHFVFINQNQYDSISPYLVKNSFLWHTDYTCATYAVDMFNIATGSNYERTSFPVNLSNQLGN